MHAQLKQAVSLAQLKVDQADQAFQDAEKALEAYEQGQDNIEFSDLHQARSTLTDRLLSQAYSDSDRAGAVGGTVYERRFLVDNQPYLITLDIEWNQNGDYHYIIDYSDVITVIFE